jgi:hypothetical protein
MFEDKEGTNWQWECGCGRGIDTASDTNGELL